ncbi:MAG: hypothetical protein QXG00_01630 [Candidatus Woesearchaeota archaeon]
MVVYRIEYLKNVYEEFEEIYYTLLKIKKGIEQAYELVNKNKMVEGKNKIIETNTSYSEIYNQIIKTSIEIL